MGQLVLFKNMLVGDRDVGAERRIGGDDIHRPQRDLLLGGGQIGQMPQRELQGVDVVNVPTAVTRQHHVHLSGADQERVKVGPEHIGGGILFQPLVDVQKLGRVLVSDLGILLLAEFLQHVSQGGDQEAAGSAGRVQQRLALLGIEHFHDQLHHAPGSEILTTVTA